MALRVGCKLEPADLATDSIVESGYAFIREPEPNGTVQLLEVWTCLSCETEQWARVEITPGEVHA